MHIGHALTYQLKGLGIIEKVQGLLVSQARLLCKQFDNARIFVLKEYRIGLHMLQCDGFNKPKITVNYLLRGDTDLMIGLLPTQLVEGLIASINALNVKIDGVKDIIVSYTTFYDIILLMRQSLSAGGHVVKPFAIVGKKHFAIDICNLVSKLIDIHDGRFATTNEALTVVACLFFKRSEIHTIAEVQMVA